MMGVSIHEIITFDVVILMLFPSLFEVLTKGSFIDAKSKSQIERKADSKLHHMNFEESKRRGLGPSTFLETSKF